MPLLTTLSCKQGTLEDPVHIEKETRIRRKTQLPTSGWCAC